MSEQVAQARDRSLHDLGEPGEHPHLLDVGDLPPGGVDPHADRRHLLDRVVVDVGRDALPLLLLCFHQMAEERLALLPCLTEKLEVAHALGLRLAPRRHVLDRAEPADRSRRLVGADLTDLVHHAHAPVGAHDPMLEVVAPSGGEPLPHRGRDLLALVRIDHADVGLEARPRRRGVDAVDEEELVAPGGLARLGIVLPAPELRHPLRAGEEGPAPRELLLRDLHRGDVEHDALEERRFPLLVVEDARAVVDPDEAAVGTDHAVLIDLANDVGALAADFYPSTRSDPPDRPAA